MVKPPVSRELHALNKPAQKRAKNLFAITISFADANTAEQGLKTAPKQTRKKRRFCVKPPSEICADRRILSSCIIKTPSVNLINTRFKPPIKIRLAGRPCPLRQRCRYFVYFNLCFPHIQMDNSVRPADAPIKDRPSENCFQTACQTQAEAPVLLYNIAHYFICLFKFR